MEHGPPLDASLAAAIERSVIDAARTALGNQIVAIVTKGSAINGDFIPYFSDFDVHIYVDESVLRGPRSLKPGPTLRFQNIIGDIDPEEFQLSQVQIFFLAASAPPDNWLPAVPGTFRVVHGNLPKAFTALDEEAFQRHARAGLMEMDRLTNWFLERIVDKPDDGLAPIVRLMGTFLKPALRQAATIRGAPAIDVWRWPQARVLSMVEPDVIPDGVASAFYNKAQQWQVARSNSSQLRSMIVDALNAYEALTEFSGRLV